MQLLEKYNAALDARAAEYREAAVRAEAQGDERLHSLNLMRCSMLGDMLKALGRVEHEGRRGTLRRQAEAASERAAVAEGRGDFDAADRERIKAETILWAREQLERLEAEHE